MPGTFAIWSSFTRWSSLGSSERFYEDLQDLLELTPKKDVLFIIGDWNEKEEVKRHLEQQANVALEYKTKLVKG